MHRRALLDPRLSVCQLRAFTLGDPFVHTWAPVCEVDGNTRDILSEVEGDRSQGVIVEVVMSQLTWLPSVAALRHLVIEPVSSSPGVPSGPAVLPRRG